VREKFTEWSLEVWMFKFYIKKCYIRRTCSSETKQNFNFFINLYSSSSVYGRLRTKHLPLNIRQRSRVSYNDTCHFYGKFGLYSRIFFSRNLKNPKKFWKSGKNWISRFQNFEKIELIILPNRSNRSNRKKSPNRLDRFIGQWINNRGPQVFKNVNLFSLPSLVSRSSTQISQLISQIIQEKPCRTLKSSHLQTRRLDRFHTNRTEPTEKIQTGVFIKWTATSLQRFNWSGPPPRTRNFSNNTWYLCLFCHLVCCSVWQCVAVCCSVLQCVAVCLVYHLVSCSVLQCVAVCLVCHLVSCSVLQCVAVCLFCHLVCCSALQCVAVCNSVLQCVAVRLFCHLVCYSLLQSVAVFCSVLQCVAVFLLSSSMLQCFAVCCRVL